MESNKSRSASTTFGDRSLTEMPTQSGPCRGDLASRAFFVVRATQNLLIAAIILETVSPEDCTIGTAVAQSAGT